MSLNRKNGECKIRIAAYMRLSKADGEMPQEETEQSESGSISMQRALIQEYIRAHFQSYELSEYQDDGFSGMDFHRPGIQKLLLDAENRKIDCVIVKDFSRFGRDYVETGSYLEQIFPLLGIRFISVNDCYDSDRYRGKCADIDIHFKNLIYDLYSRDLSRKVKASLQARKQSGQYVSSSAPFGYEKSPDDRHMLVVCEEEAEVIRRIFVFALQGMTSIQIARKLNTENVPTPIEFKIRKGGVSRKPKGGRFYWSGSAICSILKNPVYAGDVLYGKTEKERAGGRSVQRARKEWKTIRDHHAPIVSREEFQEVQKRSGMRRRSQDGNQKHSLTGKAVCGCCRRNLQLKEGCNPYFTCCNRYVTGQEDCIRRVDAVFLERTVRFRMKEFLKEQDLAVEAVCVSEDALNRERFELHRRLERAKREYGRLKREHYESYLLYAQGKQSEFCSLRAELERKEEVIGRLKMQIGETDERVRMVREGSPEMREDLQLIERYVNEIIVYNEDHIDIRWKT